MRLLLALLLMPIGCACCTWAVVPWAAFENLPMTPTVVTLPTTVPAGKEAPPTPTAGNGVAVPEEVPPPSLFPVAWDHRTVFEAELIAAEEDALRLRPGASVYHLDLNLADDLTRLTGRQEVHYTNTESVPLTEVYFRLFPNIAGGETNVTAVTANGALVQPRYELEDSVLIVPLGRSLAPNESVVIGLDYTVTVPTWPGGNYGTFAMLDEVLALAHFYPLIPAYDDEGWNAEMAPSIGDVLYADTSYYWVRLEAPAALVVVASGQELERIEQGDRNVYTFTAGPVRDFYLVASPRFAVSSTTVGETEVHSWAFPERTEASMLALEQAATALTIYNRRFGPYPYTELDIVATPTLAGGVEYPGVIVVAASVYEDPSNPFFEHVVAHEVAHQWFYGVVGNDQVDEPWLDESLTQYATWLYYRDRYGEEGDRAFAASLQRRWEGASDRTMPIGLPVAAYDGTDYSAIVYGRGPLFLDTLAQTLGEDAFAAFLQDYYRTFQWETVSTADFKRLAETHCGCDLTPLFAEWVYPRP